MAARLQKTQDGYVILLTEKMVEELCLVVGAEVELRPETDESAKTEPKIAYVTRDEALESYERSKAKFGRAYQALAK
jgi:hypothetical protein